MHVSTVFLIATQPSNKLAGKFMATISVKFLIMCPIISTQRAQGTGTCETIFTIITPWSTTRRTRTTIGNTRLRPCPRTPLPMVLAMPSPDRCRRSQRRHSWSTLCASSSQMIRYGSLILGSFTFSHISQVDSCG